MAQLVAASGGVKVWRDNLGYGDYFVTVYRPGKPNDGYLDWYDGAVVDSLEGGRWSGGYMSSIHHVIDALEAHLRVSNYHETSIRACIAQLMAPPKKSRRAA